MCPEFQKTSVTLLHRISSERSGEDEASWVRFWELYQPAMLMFAKSIGAGERSEDIVQEVLIKLVEVLRNGKYERQDGTMFRSYLKTLIRRQLIDVYRKERVRGLGRNVELTEAIVEDAAAAEKEIGEEMDLDWAKACRAAALEHVLTKTAIAQRSKEIYRAYALAGQPIEEVAKTFKVSRNLVSQIKTRIDRMVTGLLSGILRNAASAAQ